MSDDYDCSQRDPEIWYPILQDLLVEIILRLPAIRDLVSQQRRMLLHPSLSALQRSAWSVRGINCLRKEFRKKLQKLSSLQGDRTLRNAANLAVSIFSKIVWTT